MRILGAERPTIRLATAGRAGDVVEPEAPETESRALIAIGPAAATDRSALATRHPAAAFLAHLIATHQQAPQTRARRRMEPEEAMAVYRAGAGLRTATGRAVRQKA